MRLIAWIALTTGLMTGMAASVCSAQEAVDTALRRHHPWACFPTGAWKVVRVVTETLDEKGVVEGSSTTETKTTLDATDNQGVTLFVEGVVEVAGKRLEADPKCVRQGFRGEAVNANTKIKNLGTAELEIGQRSIVCQVEELVEVGSASKTTAKVYFSAEVPPYVLKRESVTTDLEGKTQLSTTIVTVVGLNLPWKVLAEIKSTALIHVVQKDAKGMSDSWLVTSPDVPGGVIQHAAKELNENGRLLRRSTLELVDYGREADEERTGLFSRRRNPRIRKP